MFVIADSLSALDTLFSRRVGRSRTLFTNGGSRQCSSLTTEIAVSFVESTWRRFIDRDRVSVPLMNTLLIMFQQGFGLLASLIIRETQRINSTSLAVTLSSLMLRLGICTWVFGTLQSLRRTWESERREKTTASKMGCVTIPAALLVLLMASSSRAASYQTNDGTIVNPIQYILPMEGDHLYSGADLEPYADLEGADLVLAYLTGADLTGADLTGADLTGADLTDSVLTGINLSQALLPSAMPILPVIDGALVTVLNSMSVTGSVQVDTGGHLVITNSEFTADGIDMRGGKMDAALHGIDLDNTGNIVGYGTLFGHAELGATGSITGSGSGLTLNGGISGSGSVSGASLYGDVDIGSSRGAITFEGVVLSPAATTTFEIMGTDTSQFDRLILVGPVALDGTARVSFTNFTPQLSDTFQLIDMTNGSASTWFANVVTPEGWILSTGGLLAVPEPGTLSSFLMAGLLLLCGNVRLRNQTLRRFSKVGTQFHPQTLSNRVRVSRR